ncbi:hypothetical protein C7476_12341 [Phyllobacterium bourgognense]|uniref:Uncharacterized protein n=1 Tax=Phyllobacterium bourgognense TaxID=314236 RepID=A0A368YEI0_9HYPH|nr:hypothetical protein C7476_12341 [Phyllobacterium bourgognense]
MDGSSVHTRKKRVIVADTETTGLLPYDRIGTLAGELQSQSLYLYFLINFGARRHSFRFEKRWVDSSQ